MWQFSVPDSRNGQFIGQFLNSKDTQTLEISAIYISLESLPGEKHYMISFAKYLNFASLSGLFGISRNIFSPIFREI